MSDHKHPHDHWPVDYWPVIETMIQADIGSRFEMAVRYLVIVLGSAAMTWATGTPVIAIWLAGFLVVNGYYSWRLSQAVQPTGRREYLAISALLMLSVALYSSCAVYLFHFDSLAFKTIAICAIVAQAMFNLSRHRIGTLMAYFDTMVVATAGTYFGMSGVMWSTSPAQQAIIVVSTLGTVCYYIIAQYRNIQTHTKLRRTQDEIVQSQKMSAVGQLTSGVAHDFNNLLTVIQGNIELAEITERADDQAKLLREARVAADRAAKLTAQLLAFSRRAHLEARAIDIPVFLERLERMLARRLPASMSVQITRATDLTQLFCDRTQLENAIMNLAVNARDASNGKANLQIEFSCSMRTTPIVFGDQTLPAGRYAVISVADDGPGIPMSQLSKVFEPFYTTKAPGEGSGLGLSSVKGFAEQSQGGVEIKSNQHGTRVTMLLPVDTPDALEIAEPA